MERVRIGIAGVGNIAQLNVRGYLDHPQCDVVALADPRPDKLALCAREWDVPRTYGSLEDMLADRDVDAVEILTPTWMHHDHVVAAARAGKHISVQKPIANTVSEARDMLREVEQAGVTFRVTENSIFFEPLARAKQLVAEGAIGRPTFLRVKTVVGTTTSPFQETLEAEGYLWRFNQRSPGGHLFDDVWHKYAAALWLFDQPITSVQAVVRKGPHFLETPTAAIFEYADEQLLGMMEVSSAERMWLRSKYYGADEFFEIQGTDGFIWVTRHTGEMLDLPPLVVYRSDGSSTSYADVDSDWGSSFRTAGQHFVDRLLDGGTPDMTGDHALRTLQLVFAVYQASNERRPVDPAMVEESVSPPWWPLWHDPSIDS